MYLRYAIKRILSTTAMYVSSSSFMYLRIACYCDACLNSSALLVGVTTLLNTIQYQTSSNQLVQTAQSHFLVVIRLKVRWQSVTIFYGTHKISQNATTPLLFGTTRLIEFIKIIVDNIYGKNPFSATNQTLLDLAEYIFRLRCTHHQLLFE